MSGDIGSQSTEGPQPHGIRDSSQAGPLFISYASYDAAVAGRVCSALEAAGCRCWIAPRDVRPGEPYAAAIVEAINVCRMVLLVLTRNAIESPHVLREVERASSKKRSILSIRLDTTELPPELEYFLSANHWLDASGQTIESVLPALIESVRGRDAARAARAPRVEQPSAAARPAASPMPVSTPDTMTGATVEPLAPSMTGRRLSRALVGAGVVIVMSLVYYAGTRLQPTSRPAPDGAPAPAAALATADGPVKSASAPGSFSPPPHSIAVLPFVNMSGDAQQDYFSDGLSEELLNSLASIRDLRVAARTSSFSFKAKDVDLSEVARKLNVGAVLEGSVRKAGDRVRITAQLIDAVTGFHLWSHTYDRNLTDILSLQTEIATAVTNALQATLLADAAAAIELGGTRNPQAFDAYLRGKNKENTGGRSNALEAIADFDEAIRRDPGFAKAYASKALSENGFAEYFGVGSETREHQRLARSAAEQALQLAPDLGEAHSALARILADGYFDFHGSLAEHQRALALSPNDSGVLLRAAWFLADIGRAEEAATMAHRGVSLDQLNPRAYRTLAIVMEDLHRYREAVEAANRSLSLNPSDVRQAALRGLSLLHLGDASSAVPSCNQQPLDWESHLCLAIAYDKLHRRADAERELAALHADMGDASAYQFAEIYAQWGDTAKSLDWLETAYRIKDPGMVGVKADPFLEPLRGAPRYREMVRTLNLPD